jgi:hypothetical protein
MSKNCVPHKIIKVVLQLKHLQCLISDRRRDGEINYNITTKYTEKQMALFRKLLLQTANSKKRKEEEEKKNVAL